MGQNLYALMRDSGGLLANVLSMSARLASHASPTPWSYSHCSWEVVPFRLDSGECSGIMMVSQREKARRILPSPFGLLRTGCFKAKGRVLFPGPSRFINQ